PGPPDRRQPPQLAADGPRAPPRGAPDPGPDRRTPGPRRRQAVPRGERPALLRRAAVPGGAQPEHPRGGALSRPLGPRLPRRGRGRPARPDRVLPDGARLPRGPDAPGARVRPHRAGAGVPAEARPVLLRPAGQPALARPAGAPARPPGAPPGAPRRDGRGARGLAGLAPPGGGGIAAADGRLDGLRRRLGPAGGEGPRERDQPRRPVVPDLADPGAAVRPRQRDAGPPEDRDPG